ncbi:TIGR02221 family CRISPR-associated protein [Thermocrinis sp.]|jgi:cell division protein DivIC|uniref:TIGR02221 family CRISPR-associated protein n=1 Tax=Thermocrinis sp. TaxID=2024383 RepID=UPI003C11DD5C
MSKGLLVSMIGRGNYRKTRYKFEDGTEIEKFLFGSALYSYLLTKGYNLDLLFVGTVNSGWGELIDLTQDIEDQNLNKKIEETFGKISGKDKTIEEGELKEWISILSEALGTEINYVLLNDPPQPEEISQKLLSLFSENEYPKVILDITHGYRFIPYAVSLGILLLKNLKDFELEIYYGFLEFRNEDDTRPVLRLNHLEELVKLSQALGILENTGDFRHYYKLISDNQEAQQIYFRIETNAQIGDSKIRELINTAVNSEYVKPIHEKVKNKYLKPLRADRTEDRLKNRARFFFERGQYLKAVLLLHEALILLVGRLKGMIGSSGLEYREREEARRYLDQLNYSEWKVLKYLRNACAHGTQPQSQDRSNPDAEAIAEARDAWENEEKFKEVMERSFEFYEKIKNGEIKV